jgi:hypothetical protein
VGLRALVAALEADGHEILTKHLLDDNVESAESRLSERDVYERDIAWLDACELLIADASGSSYGVGFEVGYVLGRADRTGQSVLLLYRADRQPLISRLISGNSHARCTTIAYTDAAELSDLVRSSVREDGSPRLSKGR